MPSHPFSASPLSKIVFVKKCILSHAKTFDELYRLSLLNDVFNKTVYGCINSSDLYPRSFKMLFLVCCFFRPRHF